jgi:pyruvate/oxaloacetate carboxyltransferase
MPTKLIVDCSTGVTTEVELTAEEIAQREADAVKAEQDRLAKEAQEAAQAKMKADVLKRLGITEQEAKALLS